MYRAENQIVPLKKS